MAEGKNPAAPAVKREAEGEQPPPQDCAMTKANTKREEERTAANERQGRLWSANSCKRAH